MAFKSVFKAFRSAFKPGIWAPIPFGNSRAFQLLPENTNGDPLCDNYGNQWVRDAGAPLAFLDSSNENSNQEGAPYKQRWEIATAADVFYIGQSGGSGAPCALYNLHVQMGDPAIPWAASPYYVQLFTPNSGGPPAPGQVPQWSMPVLREGSTFSFGVPTPFNGVSGLFGGIAIAFSVTRDVYTNPGGVLGVINADWALYSYQP